MIWLAFLLCSALIVYSGSQLSRWGEAIADETGWGGSWVGVALLASATSLPELVTGVSSVTFACAPQIAIGDAVGSCAFNIFLLAVLDAFYRIEPISAKASQGNVLSAAFGIVMLAMVGAAIVLGDRLRPIGWVAPYSFLFVAVYVLAMRIIFTFQKRQVAQLLGAAEPARGLGLPRTVARFAAHAVLVAVAAAVLPTIAAALAERTGLGQTFVGSVLVALTTSLPEFVVSVAAVRLGAVDLAVGNLFGSNLFNVAILAVDDAFFTEGALLARANAGHLATVLSTIAMTAIFILGIVCRQKRRTLFLAWDSLAAALLFALNTLALLALRTG